MTSDNDFAMTFFKELGVRGGEFALCLLRDRVFENGIRQPPSPRAQPFFDSGEWDIERTMLRLIPVSGDDACFGVFLPLCFAARGAHYTQFCSLTRCTTQLHLKQQNEWITQGIEFLSLSFEGSRAQGGIPVPFQRVTDTLSATSGVEESKDEVGDVPLQAPSRE